MAFCYLQIPVIFFKTNVISCFYHILFCILCCSCRAFGAPFYVGIIVPFVTIYLFNWVIFLIIIISLLQKTITSSRKTSYSEKKQDMKVWKQQLMIAITLSVMFGLGWGIGLPATQALYTTAVRDTFSVLFILLTAFQGLFIFIMRCARSAEVVNQWKKWFSCVTIGKSEILTTCYWQSTSSLIKYKSTNSVNQVFRRKRNS